MPTLVQRIGRCDDCDESHWIRGHEWEAAVELYFNGHFTLAQISNYFNMTSSQETELGYLKTEFDSRNANGKLLYFHDIIAATAAFQLGVISEAVFRNILQLPETSPTTSTTSTSTTTTTTTAP